MPAPKKHATARARRNKASTATTIAAVDGVVVPEVPVGVDWHPQAIAYWNDAWTSEMSTEWLESDYANVVICTQLYDDFWRAESPSARKDAAGELRLQRKMLGLDPLSRRSLEWSIEGAEDAKARGEKRRTGQSSKQPQADCDPRLVLVQ